MSGGPNLNTRIASQVVSHSETSQAPTQAEHKETTSAGRRWSWDSNKSIVRNVKRFSTMIFGRQKSDSTSSVEAPKIKANKPQQNRLSAIMSKVKGIALSVFQGKKGVKFSKTEDGKNISTSNMSREARGAKQDDNGELLPMRPTSEASRAKSMNSVSEMQLTSATTQNRNTLNENQARMRSFFDMGMNKLEDQYESTNVKFEARDHFKNGKAIYTPTFILPNGKEVAFKVSYDKNNLVLDNDKFGKVSIPYDSNSPEKFEEAIVSHMNNVMMSLEQETAPEEHPLGDGAPLNDMENIFSTPMEETFEPEVVEELVIDPSKFVPLSHDEMENVFHPHPPTEQEQSG